MRWDGSDYFWAVSSKTFRQRRGRDGSVVAEYVPDHGGDCSRCWFSTAVVLEDGTLIATVGPNVWAIDGRTGTVKWKSSLEANGSRFFGLASNVADDGTIFIAGVREKDPSYVPIEVVLVALEGDAKLAPGWPCELGDPNQRSRTRESAPKLIQLPDLVVAEAGAPLELECWWIAEPRPNFQWFKNGAAIGGATESVLRIADANALTEGIYELEAENPLGTLRMGPIKVEMSHPKVTEVLAFKPTFPINAAI